MSTTITVEHIQNLSWLETWLRKNGSSENTIGIKFKTLRMMYSLAIDEDFVKAEYYPFKKYKVSKLHQETVKEL